MLVSAEISYGIRYSTIEPSLKSVTKWASKPGRMLRVFSIHQLRPKIAVVIGGFSQDRRLCWRWR